MTYEQMIKKCVQNEEKQSVLKLYQDEEAQKVAELDIRCYIEHVLGKDALSKPINKETLKELKENLNRETVEQVIEKQTGINYVTILDFYQSGEAFLDFADEIWLNDPDEVYDVSSALWEGRFSAMEQWVTSFIEEAERFLENQRQAER